jgi:hypothetical protein
VRWRGGGGRRQRRDEAAVAGSDSARLEADLERYDL